eukprot:1065092-Rhodomonas_salina.2
MVLSPYARATPRSPVQETTISVQFVPGMRFLVFDFRVYAKSRTDIAYGAASGGGLDAGSLKQYFRCGTGIAYAASCLRARKAMAGTDIAYGASDGRY